MKLKRIKSVHQSDIVECPNCFCLMHKNVLPFHQTRCLKGN